MSSISRCNNEVTELTWENGQLSVHELNHSIPTKPQTWGSPADHTLESIVHQATTTNFNSYPQRQYSSTSMPASSIGKWNQNSSSGRMQVEQMDQQAAAVEHSGRWNKRERSETNKGFPVETSTCASASWTFCRDTDTTMMTWDSFESPRSLKTARIADDDSLHLDCSENQDGEGNTKKESCRSQSSARRSRAAAIHNLSERTDKASMLDEVIEYLKQLQAQVHMMSNARNMAQMVMPPLGMQQQIQMSLLVRMGMGMGMGMGMLDVNNMIRNMPPSFTAAAPLGGTASFVPPPFAIPPMVPPPGPLRPNVDASTISPEAYNAFLAQSMNMEFLNKMSALYRQQSSSQQPSKKPFGSSLPNDAQGQGG